MNNENIENKLESAENKEDSLDEKLSSKELPEWYKNIPGWYKKTAYGVGSLIKSSSFLGMFIGSTYGLLEYAFYIREHPIKHATTIGLSIFCAAVFSNVLVPTAIEILYNKGAIALAKKLYNKEEKQDGN